MAEDVLEVVDEDLSPVCLQLIGQGTDEGGASRARLGRQVGQEHLKGPLHRHKYIIQFKCAITSNILCTVYNVYFYIYDIQ